MYNTEQTKEMIATWQFRLLSKVFSFLHFQRPFPFVPEASMGSTNKASQKEGLSIFLSLLGASLLFWSHCYLVLISNRIERLTRNQTRKAAGWGKQDWYYF